jgi:hypothetical protein
MVLKYLFTGVSCGNMTVSSQYRSTSRPDSALPSAQSTFCWFDASCEFVLDMVAIETARAEKIKTKIIATISTAPLRF